MIYNFETSNKPKELRSKMLLDIDNSADQFKTCNRHKELLFNML